MIESMKQWESSQLLRYKSALIGVRNIVHIRTTGNEESEKNTLSTFLQNYPEQAEAIGLDVNELKANVGKIDDVINAINRDYVIENFGKLGIDGVLPNLQALDKAGYNIYEDQALKAALIKGVKKHIADKPYTVYEAISKLAGVKFPIDELLKDSEIYPIVSESISSRNANIGGGLGKAWYDASGMGPLKDLIQKNVKITADNTKGVRVITTDILKLAINKRLTTNELELLVPKLRSADLQGAIELAFDTKSIDSLAPNSKVVDLQLLLIDKIAEPNKMINGKEILTAQLIKAIEAGSPEVVQKLLMNGANIHFKEEALQKALDKSSNSEIKDLVDTYKSLERFFQKQVMPEITKVAENLSKGGNITNESVIEGLKGVLKEVYGADADLPKENTKGDKLKIKLGVIEEGMISIKSMFKSIFNPETFEQIKFEAMAEAIYEKIQKTPEFKKLAAPMAGQSLAEFQEAVKMYEGAQENGPQAKGTEENGPGANGPEEKRPEANGPEEKGTDTVKGRFTAHIREERSQNGVREI